ncbi:3 beta-hydroxysteroid dehydrogenase/Delta 5--_4-isomerase type 3 isoform X2 [Rhodnius prolixus]
MNGECLDAFKGVSTVFHCAAFISYEFPSNVEKFEANNVEGTKNVIHQCLKNNVRSLIYTSTAEVCMKPYFKNGFFTVIANQSESKILPPIDRNQLIFGSYAESKLIGEELVLEADNKKHDSGDGTLRTIALRPTFMYGEEDTTLIPTIIKFSIKLNNKICRFGGSGGRHQFVYAGNVAWAHICAYKSLNENADSVAGLPMFVTDDSNVTDLLFFCKRLCTPQKAKSKTLSPTSWYIPTLISFIFFTIFEIIYKYLCKVFPLLHRLPISPKAFVIYLGSVIFFSSLRAILYLDYNPIYEKNDALVRSNLYYTKLFETISESNDKKLINK